MAQPKKSKEEKHRAVGVTMHPKFIGMKDALKTEGVSISVVVTQAIEKAYLELIAGEGGV